MNDSIRKDVEKVHSEKVNKPFESVLKSRIKEMAYMQTYSEQGGERADNNDKAGAAKSSNTLPSYTAMIAQAILSKSVQRCALNEIYEFMERRFPPLKEKGNGWRNCVRHTLSLSDCFMKLHRPENGRSCHWAIHPTYLSRFMRGDFRKRRQTRARRNPQSSFQDKYPLQTYERDMVACDNRTFHVPMALSASPGESVDHVGHYHIPTCSSVMPNYSQFSSHAPHMSQGHNYLHGQHSTQPSSYQGQLSMDYKVMNNYYEPYAQQHRGYYQ